MLWDIFCKVIDNHGDIGVCWRLSADLASRGEQVRLWVDDPSALAWMAPQGHPGVQVRTWDASPQGITPGDVVIEAFGCELDQPFVEAIARRDGASRVAWINLEYLSAEPFAERTHGLPSPVLSGPGAGLTKHFFYPGFTPGTGGLLREACLPARQAGFDSGAWLQSVGVPDAPGAQRVALFCYEPAALDALLAMWAGGYGQTQLLVTQGRAARAVHALLGDQRESGNLQVLYLPWLDQGGFDHLLWSCDLNFVRGEDSLVRALWAGKPFIWQIYPQDDGAHHAKLEAFLDWLQAPPSLRRFHQAWNRAGGSPQTPELAQWAEAALLARERLLAQDDLATQLSRFAARIRGPARGIQENR